MRSVIGVAAVGLVLSLGLVEPVVAAVCPNDSVASGTVCIDKYEASVWYVSPENKALIRRIQRGTVRLEHLMAPGAVQLGLVDGDLGVNGCPATGNGCVDVYAVSIPGVTPAAFITWFQAAAAARNSLKRLPTNQEWQVAALGTPDGAPCNVFSGGVANTGSNAGCVSDVGALDMVANLWEWVADWADSANGETLWPAAFGDDLSNFGGPGLGFCNRPGALIRGGSWLFGTRAGVFAVFAGSDPSNSSIPAGEAGRDGFGFRCAR